MIIKMWVSIDHKVHLIDEENIVICVHFDSGATFYCENINWEKKKISRLCKNLKDNPNNNQCSCVLDDKRT